MNNLEETYPYIRKGNLNDLELIVDSVKRIKEEMVAMNISQWPQAQDYPSSEMIKSDIEQGDYFVFEKEGIHKGSFVLNRKTTEPYKEIKWRNNKFLCLHRLVSLPEFRQEEIPKILMTFAKNYALLHEYESIRLDTYHENLRANAFYQKLDYQYRGKINLPWMKGHYNCYELIF